MVHVFQLSTVMRLFGYLYNDLVICKDSPDYLTIYCYYFCVF